MKKRTFGTFLVVVLLLGVVSASAQGPGIAALPGAGWWEATQVMNVGGGTATVQFDPIVGLGVTGVTAQPASTTINAGASKTFMPVFGDVALVMDDGFKGSAIVSSDQPIVAIGALGNNNIGGVLGVSGGRAAAQYPGIGSGAVDTSVAFPLVKNDYYGKTTTFYVQTIQAGTVNAVYTMNNGASTYNDSATTTLDGQMATFSPGDVSGIPSGCTNATCLGAVTFSASVPLAGIYVEHYSSESPAQVALSTRGFTPGDYDTTVVMPQIKSMWYGRTTGIQVMNVGGASSTITMTLAYQSGVASGADGKDVVWNNVANGASVTFFPGNNGIFGGPFSGGPANEFLGSGTFTSDQPMVAICNENDFAAANVTKQSVYAGFAQSAGTGTVLFPLAKEMYGSNQTGLQVMNVGNDPVTLSAAYVFNTGSFTVDQDSAGATITVQPGSSFTYWGVTWNWSGAYNSYNGGFGAVTVSASGTGETRIVGIAQEAGYPASANSYLDTKNYEGFNQ